MAKTMILHIYLGKTFFLTPKLRNPLSLCRYLSVSASFLQCTLDITHNQTRLFLPPCQATVQDSPQGSQHHPFESNREALSR